MVERPEIDNAPKPVATTGDQRRRSIAIAVILGLLVLVFYLATIIRMGGNVLNRPL